MKSRRKTVLGYASYVTFVLVAAAGLAALFVSLSFSTKETIGVLEFQGSLEMPDNLPPHDAYLKVYFRDIDFRNEGSAAIESTHQHIVGANRLVFSDSRSLAHFFSGRKVEGETRLSIIMNNCTFGELPSPMQKFRLPDDSQISVEFAGEASREAILHELELLGTLFDNLGVVDLYVQRSSKNAFLWLKDGLQGLPFKTRAAMQNH
ncbi:MAG: hypothetical protein KDB07_09855 [Planctomycetes bacterium]|nr:hypothetical protein [Planctomycetota bacterium]